MREDRGEGEKGGGRVNEREREVREGGRKGRWVNE